MYKFLVSSMCYLAVAAGVSSASAQTVTTLVQFNGADGQFPIGDLFLSDNTLYGTTELGGAYTFFGSVFSIPVTGGPLTTLASFNNSNGAFPQAGLILSGGTLYGTTASGGANNYGTIFSVPVGGGAITTLATFDGTNGSSPYAGLILSGDRLYGTTRNCSANDCGTVFSVPVGGGTITTLASFNGSNGSHPHAGVVLSGNTLYGTTYYGGANNYGTVFSVPLSGGAITTLATFNNTNGARPQAGLILSNNSLYGTTTVGGDSGYGTVFSVPVTGGAPTTLGTFNFANGAYPQGGLTLSRNTLYGTTHNGGAGGHGTVFSIPLAGGTITTVAALNGANGAFPFGTPILSGHTLYGTTHEGEASDFGTVFAVDIPRTPVVVLPGVGGSFVPEGSTAEVVRTWLMTLGPLPGTMVLDPIARSYDDLVQSLRSNGYLPGQTLYQVPYDWRLPLAPLDGVIDGRLNAVTADGVSDESYTTCVDYLGRALKNIQIEYHNRTGQTLDAVDVVAHSMGGLVARAYIQSAAYGQTTSDGVALPKIRNLITLGTPNRGASKAFNAWNNNWESEAAYRYVLSGFVAFADQKLFDGRPLIGPGSLVRTRSSFFASDSRFFSTDFEQLFFQRTYGAGLANLLPTYLVEIGSNGARNDILSEPANRNNQLIDLNGGATAFTFSGGLTLDPELRWRAIVGTDVKTRALFFRQQSWTPPGGPAGVFEYRNNFVSREQRPNETVAIDVDDPATPNAGDGTVPAVSGESFFAGDVRLLSTDLRQDPFPAGRIQIIRYSGVEHQSLASSAAVQRRVLSELLGVPETAIDSQSISTSLARYSFTSLGKFLGATSHDPISAVVVDGQGRRTGWSPQTGRLSEIPGSIYFGGDDGFSWFFSPVSLPVAVSAQSLGQTHAFALAIEQDGRRYSGSSSGTLASGAPIPVLITAACLTSPTQTVCVPDFNCSETLDVQDIFDFLGAWFGLDVRADFNHVGGLSPQDIFDYLNAWFAGC